MRLILGVFRRSGGGAGAVSRRGGPVPSEMVDGGTDEDLRVPEGYASNEMSGAEGIAMMAEVLEYKIVNFWILHGSETTGIN